MASSYYPYQPVAGSTASTSSYNPYAQYAAQTAQYAAQVPSYAQNYFSYHLPPPPPQKAPTPPPEQPPPPPDLTTITPRVASEALERLIVSELRDAGFSAAQPEALKTLERDVVVFIERLYERAHQYANLSNRSAAIATDIVLACDEFKIAPESLRPMRAKIARKKNKKTVPPTPTLIPARSRSPSPARLPSDDESVAQSIPVTLRALPHYIPSLPPKHTYLRTPASPPKRAAIPSLEKKLETAALVQKSLKSLMVATEDAKGQAEGELLGHIVNSETGVHPRKRWILSHSSSRKRSRIRT